MRSVEDCSSQLASTSHSESVEYPPVDLSFVAYHLVDTSWLVAMAVKLGNHRDESCQVRGGPRGGQGEEEGELNSNTYGWFG